MKFETLGHVNGRTADGRVFAAGEGTTVDVDGDDEGMVDLFKGFAASGLVKDLDQTDEPEPGSAQEPAAPAETAPAEEDIDLAQLRAQAEEAGVNVDGRWGADRLRAEIAGATGVAE